MANKVMIRVFGVLFFIFVLIYLGFIILRFSGYMLNLEFITTYRLKYTIPILTILFGVFFADYNRHDHDMNYIYEVIGIFSLFGLIIFGLLNNGQNEQLISDDYTVNVTCVKNDTACEFYVKENTYLSRKITSKVIYSNEELRYEIDGNELVITRIDVREREYVEYFDLS